MGASFCLGIEWNVLKDQNGRWFHLLHKVSDFGKNNNHTLYKIPRRGKLGLYFWWLAQLCLMNQPKTLASFAKNDLRFRIVQSVASWLSSLDIQPCCLAGSLHNFAEQTNFCFFADCLRRQVLKNHRQVFFVAMNKKLFVCTLSARGLKCQVFWHTDLIKISCFGNHRRFCKYSKRGCFQSSKPRCWTVDGKKIFFLLVWRDCMTYLKNTDSMKVHGLCRCLWEG